MRAEIRNSEALNARIQALEASAKISGEFLAAEAKKALTVLSRPAPYIRQVTAELARDHDFRKDLFSLALSAFARYAGKKAASQMEDDGMLSGIRSAAAAAGQAGKGIVWKALSGLLKRL